MADDAPGSELIVKVPDVGEGIVEVELISWAVDAGQPVSRNDVIAEVITDKASVEVPAPADGVIGSLHGQVGDMLLVGEPLFSLQVGGHRGRRADDAPSPTVARSAAPATPSTDTTKETSPRQLAVVPATAQIPVAAQASIDGPPPRTEGRRPSASPAVRRRARDAGVDLRTVTGSGPAGRIVHEDLDALFADADTANTSTFNRGVTDQPIVGLRRKIAEQMVASVSSIPHITYVEEVDMTALEELRATLNEHSSETSPKLTLLPFLIRALVNEIASFPTMNAHVLDSPPTDQGQAEPSVLRSFAGVHVGIATQTDGGLVVPVLRHAEAETLWSTATRVAELAEAARTGTATSAELTGSTITISSLGALGGLVTTPVINQPETAIVGVNKLTTRPVWDGSNFVARQMMNLSSSFDHRVIDGWDAASFIQGIKRSLEQPALLFIEPDR